VQNDQEAHRRFREVVWPQLPAVLRAALVLTGGNSAEAEDLAQETLLKAFRSLDRLTDDRGVRAWLLTILRNTRIDRLRAARASARDVGLEEIGGEVEGPGDAGSAAAALENPEAMLQEFSDRRVIEAMAKLPEEIRWTLLLVDVNGLGHRDAAEVMGVPVGTVKSRAHRGRMMLRDVLLSVAKEQRIVRG
jgi:RNA polymerase sigma-70 factor, ECF subfamily